MTELTTSFFALSIEQGKKYTQEIEQNCRITMATLSSLPKNAGRTTVIAKVGDKEFTLCSLIPGKTENQPLNLSFMEGETVTLFTNGNCNVDLTGNHFIVEFDYDDEMCSDDDEAHYMAGLEEGDSDDEMMQVIDDDVSGMPESDDEEIDSDLELDDETVAAILNGKRKIPAVVSESDAVAAKKAKIVEITSQEEKKQPEKKESAEEVKQQENKKKNKKNKNKNKTAEEAAKPKEAEVKPKEAEVKPKEPEAAKQEKSPAKRTLPSGIVVEDSLVGKGAKATNGKKVAVRYIGKLANGKVFDSNTKGAPFSFHLGKGEVIKGWDLGVQGMSVGGTRKLTIPPQLAYGSRGAPPDIPPNSTLTFEVKLLDIKK